jgi:hypothetical protein
VSKVDIDQPILGLPLPQFENGVQLDFRMKLAINFAGQMLRAGTSDDLAAEDIADYALAVAQRLVLTGHNLGMLVPLPGENDECPINRAAAKIQTRTQVEANMYGQAHAERLAAGQVVSAPRGTPR